MCAPARRAASNAEENKKPEGCKQLCWVAFICRGDSRKKTSIARMRQKMDRTTSGCCAGQAERQRSRGHSASGQDENALQLHTQVLVEGD